MTARARRHQTRRLVLRSTRVHIEVRVHETDGITLTRTDRRGSRQVLSVLSGPRNLHQVRQLFARRLP